MEKVVLIPPKPGIGFYLKMICQKGEVEGYKIFDVLEVMRNA